MQLVRWAFASKTDLRESYGLFQSNAAGTARNGRPSSQSNKLVKPFLRCSVWTLLAAFAVIGVAQNPATTAHPGAQSAADALKEAAGTDGAFMAAALIKDSFQNDNLATLLRYPTDEIVVVKLKGSELRQAFERSLSLFPQPNSSFLQLAGFTVEFSAKGDAHRRVLNVTVNGAMLDENRIYTVAMPSSLGRGGLGYFKIWDKAKIDRTLADQTMESLLKGKKVGATTPRWVQRS